MSSKKILIVFLGMIGLGLSGFYLIQFGAYPVAIVGSSMISARSLETTALSAHRYYSQSLKAYGEERPGEILEDHGTILELRRAALDRLIEDAIIHRELKARLGETLESAVTKKLDGLTFGDNTEDAVSVLYGLTFAEFREMVLVPKAREEILAGRVFGEGVSDFEELLKKSRQGVKVIILAPDLAWDGEKVAIK